MPDPIAAEQLQAEERARAWNELRAHRWYPYRACAPSETDPALCAVDDTTPINVFLSPDVESQADRPVRERRAKAVCARCPIAAACAEYAIGTPETGLREPDHIWGGLTGLERERLHRDRVNTEPGDEPSVHTSQRDAILLALAAHTNPEQVAAAAGMDVRTANWQRSRLVTMFHLDPATTSRTQLLDTAIQQGILAPGTVVVPDGPLPVAAIPGMQHRLTPPPARGTVICSEQMALPGIEPDRRPRKRALALVPGGAPTQTRRTSTRTLAAAS